MGCDIHLYVEIREGGVWRPISGRAMGFVTKATDRWEGYAVDFNEEEDHGVFRDDEGHLATAGSWYHDRNYNLFGMLAGVRSYGEGFENLFPDHFRSWRPLAPGRGLPLDVSSEIKALSDGWGSDGHSHTWFGLDEWLNFDLLQEIRYEVKVHDDLLRSLPEPKDGSPKTVFLDSIQEPTTGRVKVARRLLDDPMSELPLWLSAFGSWVPRGPLLPADEGYGEIGEDGVAQLTRRESYLVNVPRSWWACCNALYRGVVARSLAPADARFVMWFDN